MAERQPPTYLQSSCYEPSDFRLEMQDLICGEGVAFHSASGTELKVTESVPVGNSVLVAAGGAFVSSSYSEVGIYHVWNDATVQVDLDTPDVTNARIDAIVARVVDPEFEAGDAGWVLDSVTGTPSASAALTPAGIAASAADLTNITCVLLAYVLVGPSGANPNVQNADILDQRSAYQRCNGTPYAALVAAAATSNFTATTPVLLATTEHLDAAYFTVASSVITVLREGLYDVAGFVSIAADTNTTGIEVHITKNGTAIRVAGQRVANTASTVVDLRASPSMMMVPLAANDTIQMVVASTLSADTAHSSPNNISRLVVRKVG